MLGPEHCETCAYAVAEDQSGVLLQATYWRLVLARDQAYLGRSYLVAKDHKASLSELTTAEWDEYIQLVKRIESSYESTLGSGRPFNWACLMNNAFQTTPPMPHVHWHLWPRHAQPITIGDKTFIDTEYAHHHEFDRKEPIDDKTFNLLFEKLQSSLNAYRAS